ncbi:MAG: amidohydrolase family protein [Paenibacillaceae bacterium]|nr:amidohydrolase family protein [Paenibacillaceae bacterium]
MRIDAHQHYWRPERGDYGWLTQDMTTLFRDYLPEHLAGHLDAGGIDGTIVVQAAATHEETEFMLSLADRDPRLLGVVGWVDLLSPAYREQLERFRRHPKFVGIRVMIQDMSDPGVVLEPAYVEAFRYLEREGLPVDLLVTAGQLPVLLQLMKEVPGLHGVVDHLAKPPIASGSLEPWTAQISEMAGYPGLYCKLSGMVTEAKHDGWQYADFVPYVRVVLEAFGAKRVMFGSDWPVCLLAATYEEVIEVLERALPDEMSAGERADLFGNNARTFYRL